MVVLDVRGYLGELAPIVSGLGQATPEALELAYRRSHSIRGTAGLLNQFFLSRLSQIQEEAFEALMQGALTTTKEVTLLLNQTFGGIARSIDFHLNRPVDQVEILRTALRSQRRAAGLPSEDDDAVIEVAVREVITQENSVSTVSERAVSGNARRSDTSKKPRSSRSRKVPANEATLVTEASNVESTDEASTDVQFSTRTDSSISDEIADSLVDEINEQFTAVENIDAEYAAIYQEDSEGLIAQLRDELERLKMNPGDLAVIKVLRRLFHNLKGAAATVRLKPAATLAHRVEDVLDWIHDSEVMASADCQVLLSHVVDALEDLAGLKFDRREMTNRVLSLICRLGSASASMSVETTSSSELASRGCCLKKDVCDGRSESTLPMPSSTGVSIETLEPSFIDIDSSLASSTSWFDSTGPLVSKSMSPTSGSEVHGSQKTEALSRNVASSVSGEAIRIPLDNLNDMTRLVGELVVNRTGFEQRLMQLRGVVGELKLAMQRMQALSRKFDEHYEARALAKGSFLWPNAGGDEPGRNVVHPTVASERSAMPSRYGAEFDDLELDRYTEFHLLSRQLAESISDLGTMGHEFGNMTGDFESLLTRQATISRDLQSRLMQARLLPLGGLLSRLKRIVRVAGETLNKAVDLEIDGAGVHLDKSALDDLLDPLTHLLRNAVAHGIESSDVRQRSGKLGAGRITIKAFHQGTQVVIQVADDGAGFDLNKLRAAAVRAGHLSAERAASLDEESVRQLAFLHGLSTSEQIDEVSGRGVGLDVVKSAINRLKGTLTLASTEGVGTTFTIRLPMTLALTKAMLVRVGDGTFAIPMQDVQQIVRIDRSQLDTVGRAPVLRMGGRVFPLNSLADQLHQASRLDPSSASLPVLFVRTGDEISAVAVDRILAAREIVVKSLGTHLRKVKGFLGATFLGDGTVIPILNCFELLHPERSSQQPAVSTGNVDREETSQTGRTAGRTVSRSNASPTVMIVDDSVSVRRITAKLLNIAGMKTILARDGVDALEILQGLTDPPDMMLLDVEMPRMDGYELLGTLRGQEKFSELPIVMITSRAGTKHRDKAADLGATEYLIKPYNEDELISLIRRQVSIPRRNGMSVMTTA